MPDFADAHYNLGKALLRLDRVSEAIEQYEQVLLLKPEDTEVQNQLAWVLATCGDEAVRNGARAVELAERANQIKGVKDPVILNTLAAAYAEAGRFAEAVATAQQALELASVQTNIPLIDALRMQIRFYQAGSPFRDTGQTNSPAAPIPPLPFAR
jgi:Flp pilus assembly protein TadD